MFTKLLKMEGKAAGVKQTILQHCKRFHNLCGIHFIENLNGHGSRRSVGEDEVVIQVFKQPVIVNPRNSFSGHHRASAKMTVEIVSFSTMLVKSKWMNVGVFKT